MSARAMGAAARGWICCLVAVLVGTACGTAERSEPPPRAVVERRVGQLLYEENLISDAEVLAEVGRTVTAMDRDGVPPDSVLSGLHAWLEEWVAANPDRVARARLMPRPPRISPLPGGSPGA